MQFALNHMVAPDMDHATFMDLAVRLGCVGVEFRNDLDRPLFDGEPPERIGPEARKRGLRVLALAELKNFNSFSDETLGEACALIDTAVSCGAEGIALIPRCDGMGLGNGERQANLRIALRELAPLLREAGLIGFVEPLGFAISSLRSKEEALAAITAVADTDTFRLVHDTFHHHIAGEQQLYPAETGIVHVSGVSDPEPSVSEMRDRHRVLVGPGDRLKNVEQLERLHSEGYEGPVSFEPFAPEIHALQDPGPALAASIDHIRREVSALAA